MQAAIGNMLKNGLKNISDETARAYLEHLAGLGEIQIGGEIMTGSALMRDYDDFSKQEFKEAAKCVAKDAKKKNKADKPQDAPKRAKSGYVLFCEEMRPGLKDKGLSFQEISKELGVLWKNQETKDKYNQMAAKLKGEAAEGAGETKKPAKAGKTIKLKQQLDQVDAVDTDLGVKYATAAAKKFAEDNNIDGGLAKYGASATGKDGAFKLADLKKIVEEIEADTPEEEVEEEVEEEEEDEGEEECDEETDPADWVGWSCRVWSEDADDWMDGEITKYNAKKSTHTVKFSDGTKPQEIDIKALEAEEHFEWND